jgi:hypothetical protein
MNLEDLTDEDKLEIAKLDRSSVVEIISEESQMSIVKNNPTDIHYIKNTTEKVQLEVIKIDSSYMYFIKKPFESVQIEAVKNLDYKYIKDNAIYVKKYITSQKALELYEKLKNAHKIIK